MIFINNLKCNHIIGYVNSYSEDFSFVSLRDILSYELCDVTLFKFCPNCGHSVSRKNLSILWNSFWCEIDKIFDEVDENGEKVGIKI